MSFEMISGLISFLAFGAPWIAVIAWLCRRAGVAGKLAGVLLAAMVTIYCGGVALILIVGTLDAGESPRVGGVLSVMLFILLACAASRAPGLLGKTQR